VPAGEAFTTAQRREIDRARHIAAAGSGYEYAVYVGPVEGEPRAFAERVHAATERPDETVTVVIDPGARCLEIVTGAAVRRHLPDADCALVAMNMQTAFAAGDLVGGIVRGVQQLGDHARHPATLHTEQHA